MNKNKSTQTFNESWKFVFFWRNLNFQSCKKKKEEQQQVRFSRAISFFAEREAKIAKFQTNPVQLRAR
jgi:hypothetical protein